MAQKTIKHHVLDRFRTAEREQDPRENRGKQREVLGTHAQKQAFLDPPNLPEMPKTGLFLYVLEPEEKVASSQKSMRKIVSENTCKKKC